MEIIFMCNCINIEMGSYQNQTQKILPWTEAKNYRNPIVGIDNCLLEEIEYLWSKGVKTTESCCGHNKVEGYIMVNYESIDLMIWLGYDFYQNASHIDFNPSMFKPKSLK